MKKQHMSYEQMAAKKKRTKNIFIGVYMGITAVIVAAVTYFIGSM